MSLKMPSVEALELLLAAAAELLHHLLEPEQPPPPAVAPALAQQPAQRGLEVPAVEHVLAQPREELLDVGAEGVLGPVPGGEATRPEVGVAHPP